MIAYNLASDGKSIDLRIFVNAPYDRYVVGHPILERQRHRRFGWRGRGGRADGVAGGAHRGWHRVRHADLCRRGRPAAAETVFALYGDRVTAMKQPEVAAARYVLYFNESLRGLSGGGAGDPARAAGGRGHRCRTGHRPDTRSLRGRVEVVSYPSVLSRGCARASGRWGSHGAEPAGTARVLRRMVEQRGLRAQLRSGNLLTGQLYVALDFFPDAPKVKLDWSQDPAVFPVVPSTIRTWRRSSRASWPSSTTCPTRRSARTSRRCWPRPTGPSRMRARP